MTGTGLNVCGTTGCAIVSPRTLPTSTTTADAARATDKAMHTLVRRKFGDNGTKALDALGIFYNTATHPTVMY